MRFLLLLGLLAAAPLGAEAFWLRNADPNDLFCWWAVPFTPDAGRALGAASADPSVVHRVAPGERVQVVLSAGQDLFGMFLSWNDLTTPTTPVVGGWIRTSEAPTSGTLVVDTPTWKASNRGRSVAATLQEWGLEPPLLSLNLRTDAWNTVAPIAEWGPSFLHTTVQPSTLQALVRDGALWVRLKFTTLPSGTSASLLLRRGVETLEWPLQTGPVWAWSGEAARAVGRVLVGPGVLLGWIPLDRFSPPERSAWTQGQWAWAVTTPRETLSFDLGPFSAEDLP